MGVFSWLIQTINNEYERRIKAASQVKEYGLHHGHDHHADDDHEHDEAAEHPPAIEYKPESAPQAESIEDDAEAAEIMNVPRGTPVDHTSEPAPEHT